MVGGKGGGGLLDLQIKWHFSLKLEGACLIHPV